MRLSPAHYLLPLLPALVLGARWLQDHSTSRCWSDLFRLQTPLQYPWLTLDDSMQIVHQSLKGLAAHPELSCVAVWCS